MSESSIIKKEIKRRIKRRFFIFGIFNSALLLLTAFSMGVFLIAMGSTGGNDEYLDDSGSTGIFDGEYNEELPIFDSVKGRGPFTDEVAQLAVGAAIKYKLLPSVILSQYGYESAFGQSLAGKLDTNYFGITWFDGCQFPKGTARGIGGSEGGWYMRFPNKKANFSYYGYMVATQDNFNKSVGNKSPGECLLILGRGGYAAAGITEDSDYYRGAMEIIKTYNLTEYDEFAIKKWGTGSGSSSNTSGADADSVIKAAETQLGVPYVWGGTTPGKALDCSGLTQYAFKKGANIDIGRVTTQQETQGTEVWKKGQSYSKLKKGDLLFYGAKGNTHHVTIYIGTGKYGSKTIIEAPEPGKKVHYSNMDYSVPDFAKRVIKESSGGGSIGGEWANPFPGSSLSSSSFASFQIFGTHPGGEFRQNGFHDGLDFGSMDHPGSELHAAHGGKVVYVGNPGINGLGSCVIVISDSGLNMVYQEFASGTNNARVTKGQTVKAGQVIGIRDTDHLHFGITRMDWRQAQVHAFSDDGTWIDPLPYLQKSK